MATLAQVLAEGYRLRLLGGLEAELRGCGFSCLAGIDEAGRGSLAGPVVAAAVIPDPERPLPGVDDSKRLPADRRRRLSDWIRRTAVSFSVCAVAAETIDRVNILQATRQAMWRALEGLSSAPDCVLVDAVELSASRAPCLGLVRGDRVAYSIACASILAKVERDAMMVELDRVYPQYGFAHHKGYAAPEHLEALAEFGPTPAHRLTFRRVLPRSGETVMN